jgi:hypothetical protein
LLGWQRRCRSCCRCRCWLRGWVVLCHAAGSQRMVRPRITVCGRGPMHGCHRRPRLGRPASRCRLRGTRAIERVHIHRHLTPGARGQARQQECQDGGRSQANHKQRGQGLHLLAKAVDRPGASGSHV